MNISRQNRVLKWHLKWQIWMKLDNELHWQNQDPDPAQTDLPVYSAPFFPKVSFPANLDYNSGSRKKSKLSYHLVVISPAS